jgi:hypothetical protein
VDAKTIADATLHGWKEGVADRVGRRAPVADDLARAALGAVFFTLSLMYVVRTVRAFTRALRS